MTKSYDHILRSFRDTPWAIMPEKLDEIAAFLQYKAEGGDARPFMAVERTPAAAPGNIAVLPLYGLISQRMNMMTEMSGGTSTQMFAGAFRQLVADESIKAIIIDVDSPGGSVYGVDELSKEIFDARGRKPVVAVANSLMASAAYYIAASADEVVVTPGGEVGSIGVLAVHQDLSGAYEQMGVRHTIISAGKYKGEATDIQPLSDEALQAVQARVNEYYSMFVGAVARGRGVSASEVRSGFGEGRVVGAKQAVSLGMADRIGTIEETIIRFAGRGRVAVRAPRAEEDEPRIELNDERQGREDRLRRLTLGV